MIILRLFLFSLCCLEMVIEALAYILIGVGTAGLWYGAPLHAPLLLLNWGLAAALLVVWMTCCDQRS